MTQEKQNAIDFAEWLRSDMGDKVGVGEYTKYDMFIDKLCPLDVLYDEWQNQKFFRTLLPTPSPIN